MSNIISGPWGDIEEPSDEMSKRLSFSGTSHGQLENRIIELDYISKLASSDMADVVGDFVKSLRSEPGKAYVLNIALGDSDRWGTNNNGEFFFGKRKFSDFPQILARFPFLAKYENGGLLTDHPRYGSKTFLSNPAHFFDHHRNKDVAGAYGRCVFQYFNPEMRRVELVFELWPRKMREVGAGDVLDRLENDIPIESSMGCRVPWDVCKTCGNVARIKREYCSCLRRGMNRVSPDGVRNGAMNFLSSFHDMSRVFKNADRSSYVLQKVASVEGADSTIEKTQAKKKRAAIDKRIPGMATMVSTVECDKAIPVEKLRELKKKASLDDILGASVRSGFVLKPQEFQFLLLEDVSPGVGEKHAQDGVCFASSTQVHPVTIGEGEGCENLFTEYLEDRWLSDDALSMRIMKTSSVSGEGVEHSEEGIFPAVSALYNGYVCGIMGQVLTHGVSSEFVKDAAVNPKQPLKLLTPMSMGTGMMAYMLASMLQSTRDPNEQRSAVSSLLSDPRVAGILTAIGTAALRRKLGI